MFIGDFIIFEYFYTQISIYLWFITPRFVDRLVESLLQQHLSAEKMSLFVVSNQETVGML